MRSQGLALFAVALAATERSLFHGSAITLDGTDPAPSPSTLYNIPDVKGYIHSNYDQTWTVFPDRDCDAYIPATYMSPSFQDMLCSNNPDAPGFIASLDGAMEEMEGEERRLEASPALCGPKSDLADLCWSLDDCFGYITQNDTTATTSTLSERGYLLTYTCGTAGSFKYEKGTTLYQKMDPTYDTCPLGEVMTVLGGDFPEVSGAYAKNPQDIFMKVDGLAKITWHHSGCGWVISRKVEPTVSGPPRRLEKCEDAPAALATLVGSDQSENLCETLVEGWGRAAYCSDPIVGKLCANTCDRCDLTKKDPAVCSKNTVCGHPVYQALCPTTCASAEAVTLKKTVVEARLDDLRIRVKNVMLNWKAKAVKHEEEVVRRLGTEIAGDYASMYEEVYRTFNTSGCGLAPTYDVLPQLGLFDMVSYHTPFEMDLMHSCNTTDNVYVTTNFTYCPRTNVLVQYHEIPLISENSCWTKCGTYGNTTDTFFADGTTDWCSGFSDTFTKETTALCIPRETCEEICTLLGEECHSIDMHRSRPLCYINSVDAGTGNSCDDPNYLMTSQEFDIVTKVTTPSAPEMDTARIYWTTYTGKSLAFPTDPHPTATNFTFTTYAETATGTHNSAFGVADRVKCEQVCIADPMCYGFYLDMGATPPLCTVISYDCLSEDGTGRPCNDAPVLAPGYFTPCDMKGQSSDCTRRGAGDLKLVGHRTLVLKNMPAPCTAAIATEEGMVTLEKKLGFSADGDLYVSEDNLTRLVFKSDVQGCDGWSYEMHKYPLSESLTLENCTDYPIGANLFLKAYLNVMPPSGAVDFEYPCQYAFDEGLCTDTVVAGLCAHTCSPLKVLLFHAAGLQSYQDTGTNNSECLGNNDVAAYDFISTYHPRAKRADNIKKNGPNATGNKLYNFCDDLAGWSEFYNTTDAACVLRPWSPIVMGLCKEACALYMDPTDDPVTPVPIDETSPSGALFTQNRRLLRINEEKIAEERAKLVELGELGADNAPLGDSEEAEEHRRLLAEKRELFFVPGEYTTSNRGAGPGFTTYISSSLTVHYTTGDAGDASWMPIMQTWANGTNDPMSIYNKNFTLFPDFTYQLGATCANGTVVGGADMYQLMNVTEMYPATPELEDEVSLDYSCRATVPCPKYFTCIVDQPRGDLKYAAHAEIGGENLTDMSGEGMVTPNVIISTERSFGYVIVPGDKWKLTPKIYRNEIGSIEVEIKDQTFAPEVFAYQLELVTTAADGYYLEKYMLALPETDYMYISDAIKVEALGPDGAPITSPLDVIIRGIGMYEPSLVKLLLVEGDTVTDVMGIYDGADEIDATLLESGIYVVGLAPNACMMDPCDENADCDPAGEPMNPCMCKADYEGSGLDGECALKAASYKPDSFHYYVKIINTDALQFGWHVNDIGVTLMNSAGTILNAGPPNDAARNYKTSDYLVAFDSIPGVTLDSVTGKVVTKNTKFYTGPIGKSHYPYATDTFTITGNIGSYTHGNVQGAKYGNQNLGDDNRATQWWSEALNVYPESQSIEFVLSGDHELVGLRVGQEVMHASSYRIETGPVSDKNDPECGMGEGMPRCTPFNIVDVYICKAASDCPKSLPFCIGGGGASATGQCSDKSYPPTEVSEVHNTEGVKDSQTSIAINTPISCGKADTQIFGEVMVFATSEVDPTPKWSGVYYNDVPVMSPCHCHRLCISHLEEGCKSWKFYEEVGGIKHCYLQSSIFGPGEGYYGTTEATWTSWTSGTPQYRYYKDSFPMAAKLAYDRPWLLGVEVSPPEALATGEPFTLMIGGTGLPYSPNKAMDESPLQRVKIVPAGESCAVRVPATVSGISCVKSTKKSKLLVENPMTVYTLCGPRPSMTSATELELSGVSIMPSTEPMDYEVCYCEFDCFDPVRWQKVPGMISTPASTYTWGSTPEVVTRHATDMLAPEVSITVTRPAFGHHSLNKYWTVKLVRDYFSCELNMDTDLFFFESKMCDGPDVCTFTFQIYISAQDVGRYYVCFDEGMGSSAIPEGMTGDKFLEILEIDPDHSHPRGIFHNQYFSALAGGAPTDLELSGYKIPLPSTSRVTLSTGTCGDLESYFFPGALTPPAVEDTTAPELLGVTVPAGGVSTSELIVLTFSERVTVEECKGNFVLVGPMTLKIPCGNATAFKDTITLSVLGASVGGYNLTIETEALLDLAGNRITYVTEVPVNGGPEKGFTISATETAPPTVIRTEPLSGASSPDGIISFLFTEDIAPLDGLLSLSLCGSSCDDKDLVKNYHIIGDNDTVNVSGNVLTIELGPAAKDFAYYELVIAPGVIQDMGGNAFAGPYALEFFMDSGTVEMGGFDMETSTAKVKLGASSDDPTDSKVVFDFALDMMTQPGTYNLCYCNDQEDTTLALLGDSAKTYKLMDDTVCNSAGIIDMDADEDSCISKCSAGCVGPECYCSGLPEAKPGALCLPKEECSARCTNETGCIGINVHDTLPICYLVNDCVPFEAPTPPPQVLVQVVASSLALTMSDADIAVLMADEDTAMQAFATGLTAELGVPVVVTGITFGRRLTSADARNLQAGTVTVDFYTEDTSAFAAITSLATAPDTTALVNTLTTELGQVGMMVTIAEVTVAAPSYASISVDPPPCNANITNCTVANATRQLSDGSHVSLVSASYLYFAADNGTACTQVTDFKERAGTIAVTARVLVGVDYVVTPGIEQSLEVSNFMPEMFFGGKGGKGGGEMEEMDEEDGEGGGKGGGMRKRKRKSMRKRKRTRKLQGKRTRKLQGPDMDMDEEMDEEPEPVLYSLIPKDRIMVIDCGGTCGVSGPTDKVAGYGDIATWNDKGPMEWYVDPPSVDDQNIPDEILMPTTPMPTPMGYSYEITYDSSYYAGFNVDISQLKVPIDGTLRDLKEFQCYEMCGVEACDGPWCKCEGYLSGIDGPTSNALCADEPTCQYLCDQVDCQAIDMAKDVPRCFLNTLPKNGDGSIDAPAALAALVPDDRYRIISQTPPNEEGTASGRRLSEESYYSSGSYYYYYYYTPSMLERKDLGYSWGQMIRFDKLTFTTGGTFKLCFCDSALIGAVSTPCLTKKDYAIEVGKVHSSGVSCLLSQPKLQRAECDTMYHGAEPKPLRCYSGIPVPEPVPPLLISTQIDVSDSTEEGTYVETGSSEGAYSPEEEGMQPAPQSGNAMPPMRKRA